MSSPAKNAKSSWDGKEWSTFAEKAPVPRKTGNAAVDSAREPQRHWKMVIVDAMEKQPHLIRPLFSALTTQDLEAAEAAMSASAGAAPEGAWTGEYKVMSRIPNEWKAQYLVKLSIGNTGFTLNKPLLTKMVQANHEEVDHLFYYELQAKAGTPFLLRWAEEYIARKVFEKRGTAMGGRLLKLLNAGAVSSNGVVDWKTGGAYQFRWAAGVATHIIHCLSPEELALPSHIRITPEFVLCDNYSDLLARVELLPASYYLWTLLPKECAVVKRVQSEKRAKENPWVALTAEVTETVDAERARRAEELVAFSTPLLDEVEKQRKTEHMEKARAQLVRANEARQKRRRITLAVAAPEPAGELGSS